jgi:hypothetical protein
MIGHGGNVEGKPPGRRGALVEPRDFRSVGIVRLLCNTVGIIGLFAISCTGHDIETGNKWRNFNQRRMGHRPGAPEARCEP